MVGWSFCDFAKNVEQGHIDARLEGGCDGELAVENLIRCGGFALDDLRTANEFFATDVGTFAIATEAASSFDAHDGVEAAGDGFAQSPEFSFGDGCSGRVCWCWGTGRLCGSEPGAPE